MKKSVGRFLSKIYRLVLKIDEALYQTFHRRTHRVPARVISIGNITWGGTGKTPLVIMLARELHAVGKKVAVLTRGYGRDETAEMKEKLPKEVAVLVGRDRVAKAQEAIRLFGAEILILDDGFQHRRLARNLDVVTINSTVPFGPGGLIPLGTLREPLENLSRADLFILTKSNLGSKNIHWIKQRVHEIKPEAPVFEAIHEPRLLARLKTSQTLPLSELRAKRVATLSGIGDPFSFEKTVENLGAEILFAARFEDHHPYSSHDLEVFAERCLKIGATRIVTTQKDAYRIQKVLTENPRHPFHRLDTLVLQIEFVIVDEEDFIRRCADSV